MSKRIKKNRLAVVSLAFVAVMLTLSAGLYMAQTPEMEVVANDMQDHQNNLLYQGLGELDERSQDIIRCRWLGDTKETLQKLADRYGVSAERIRQLEVNAMNKIRASFSA